LFQLETPLYMYIGNTANIVICWRKNTTVADITWRTSPGPLCEFCTASDERAGPGNEASSAPRGFM